MQGLVLARQVLPLPFIYLFQCVSNLSVSQSFATTNMEHCLLQKSPMIEMWKELGLPKSLIFGAPN
jgi:hypothetical protein